MAALLTGQAVSKIAADYKMPASTVSLWNKKVIALRQSSVEPVPKKRIGDAILAYLEEALYTLKAQVVIFGEAAWLRKQSASEVGVLHGILADKTIRLLEALARDAETQLPTKGEGEGIANGDIAAGHP